MWYSVFSYVRTCKLAELLKTYYSSSDELLLGQKVAVSPHEPGDEKLSLIEWVACLLFLCPGSMLLVTTAQV